MEINFLVVGELHMVPTNDLVLHSTSTHVDAQPTTLEGELRSYDMRFKQWGLPPLYRW